jgi:beta-phosphoglucomutase
MTNISKYKAFIFDLNGTMIDDMSFHIKAWQEKVNSLGANLTYEETKLQCYGKNEELLERVFPNRFTTEEKTKLGKEKELLYYDVYKPHMKLLNGLQEVLDLAKAKGIKMAIGSAAMMQNVNFILDHLNLHHYFDAIVSADDVNLSKPHPETFIKAAHLLNISSEDCLVFEDSPKGIEAAQTANMDSFVLTTMHPVEDFGVYKNVVGFGKDFSLMYI